MSQKESSLPHNDERHAAEFRKRGLNVDRVEVSVTHDENDKPHYMHTLYWKYASRDWIRFYNFGEGLKDDSEAESAFFDLIVSTSYSEVRERMLHDMGMLPAVLDNGLKTPRQDFENVVIPRLEDELVPPRAIVYQGEVYLHDGEMDDGNENDNESPFWPRYIYKLVTSVTPVWNERGKVRMEVE